MKEQSSAFFTRISQLLSRGIGKQQMSMFYGQGGRSLQEEAQVRAYLRESQRQQAFRKLPVEQVVYTSLDTETTGFHPEHGDEIISIGAVHMKGPILTDEIFSTFIRPSCSIPFSITELTGISEQDVAEAPVLADIMGELNGFLHDTVVIGWYIGHEVKFFNYFLWRKYRARFTYRVLEMKRMVECVYPELSACTGLEEVLDAMNIRVEKRHEALADAQMTAQLWGLIQNEIRHRGIYTMEELYTFLAEGGR
ncbi:DNA polymerase III epsilon subunit family exonuclease [Aneurinibacillus soli]|uniref:DNA polymerase III PolC-type n=1 Tax=Aneurinibacillus soli TaxID=1500254 RepID=A0A0U4NDC7_9BACL|nr:exonuclease domain-containing protein [Aneurinibacillus soli]PYE62385.1 DNA polymerase III epsilon subunit family exonuclease [Aneurinibacillus soli]BAU26948.1 DNA polymerase III PolC-type [Aneurinibacillus soli]